MAPRSLLCTAPAMNARLQLQATGVPAAELRAN
jgi:hypothetical protein